jgi:NADPH-dependent glutamate synthase beta subunit-like oxidoreductase/Pyruvate/2-oxoacid:ferredoxin oxidoreductase delta subunit
MEGRDNMTRLDCIDPEKIIPISRFSTEVFKTGTWGVRLPVHGEKLPPCRAACPAGEDIPTYVALAREGDLEGAFLTIAQENPLPAVCGRVCYHPCEGDCLRHALEGAVSIHRVERYVGDYGLEKLSLSHAIKETGASVAIVGSGPAGLSCAYHARRLGHGVTIFEAENVLGGLLRLGIPAYRLPRDVLDKSVKMILDMGIETRTGFRLGERDSWKTLDSFDAVFLALGAHDLMPLSITGMGHSGVMSGLGFLKRVNMDRLNKVVGPVAVMGGGNTAVDAARVSLRLGAETTMIYRRSRGEMPASAEEISDALREGVKLMECALPVAIEPSGGGLNVTCLRTEAQGRDASGRTRYVPVKGSEFEVDVGTFIIGTGQAVKVPEEAGPVLIAPEGITVTPYLNAGKGKFYAGGDMVAIPRRVCDAIGSGKLAALSMHARMNGLDMEAIWARVQIGGGTAFSMHAYLYGGDSPDPRIKNPIEPQEVKPEWFEPSERIEPSKLQAEKAVQGFEEVVGDWDEEELLRACSRCFSCGICTSCDRCYLYCPEVSVTPPSDDKKCYEGDSEYCKGCGVCAAVCPRGVMTMRERK